MGNAVMITCGAFGHDRYQRADMTWGFLLKAVFEPKFFCICETHSTAIFRFFDCPGRAAGYIQWRLWLWKLAPVALSVWLALRILCEGSPSSRSSGRRIVSTA